MGATPVSPVIVVGLGNPGPKYSLTLHNLGFLVVDLLADRLRAPKPTEKFHSLLTQCDFEGRRVILVKPLTYMNLSGKAVGEISTFYKILPAENLLVISDDLDLPPGQLRLRTKGGAGGHNGLKSINETLGSEEYPRLRIGIGRHAHQPAEDYVLSRIPKSQEELYQEAINKAADAVETTLKDGILKAMNQVNKKTEEV